MKYIKYKKTWWQIDEKTPFNSAIVYNFNSVAEYDVDLNNFKIIEAPSFEYLDWTNTDIFNPKSNYGWLDRNGNFYGCNFACHENQAKLIHKTYSQHLEILGWIHISAVSPERPETIFAEFFGDYKNGVIPTDKQLKYLLAHPQINIDSVKNAVTNGNYKKAKIYENKIKNKDGGMQL